MNKILTLVLLVTLAYAQEMSVMERFYKLPPTKTNVSVTEYSIPLDSEDPIHICDIPENHSAMFVVCWEDVKVTNLLGEKFNIIDHTQDEVNLVRVFRGHPIKIKSSGNVFLPAGPVIIWVKGGSDRALQGNVRVKIRLNKKQENQ